MKRVRRVLLLLLVAGLGYAVAALQPYLFRPVLLAGQDAISDGNSGQARVSLEDAGGRVLSIRPAGGEGNLLLVMYVGAPVRPQAYEWLGRALAERGVHTVIPEFFADLAITDTHRADALIARYAAGRPVVLAGHSLGGVMAADYTAAHRDTVRGLVLMASYPQAGVDLTGAPIVALSLLAERDAVADGAKVRAGLAQLPAGSRLETVPGAVHSFFGRYGPQAGDGVPTVSRAQAEATIVRLVGDYLAGVR